MRTPSLLLVAAVALLGVSGSTSHVSAQARDLGSPWGGSTQAPEGAGPDTQATTAAPEGAPPEEAAADSETVPPPPGTEGGVGAVRLVQPGDVSPELRTGPAGLGGAGARRAWLSAEPDNGLRIPASISTRLRALDADLQVLAVRGSGGIVDGVLAIVMGATAIGIGVYMDVSGSAPGPSMTPYLYVYGGAGIVRGILDFAFMRNPSGVAMVYAHMPMTTLGEVRARLRYGERELESLAQTAELSRILDGALSIATGLAVVPVYLGPTNFAFSSAFDYFVLIGAAVSVTTGIITLFSVNESERRWSAYREMRERLLATEQGSADELELERAAEQLQAFEVAPVGPELRPVLAGTQGGLFAGAAGTF